jgi:hypothetical protein
MDLLTRPDFIILGFTTEDGVRFWACNDVPQANFTAKYSKAAYEARWQLKAELRNVLIAQAPAYQEAFEQAAAYFSQRPPPGKPAQALVETWVRILVPDPDPDPAPGEASQA